MRLRCLASGSSGNSTYVGDDDTHILVDAGISKKRITEGLAGAGLGLKDISAILITHEHTDHICSLGVMARAAQIPIYATEGTIRGIMQSNSLGEFDKDLFRIIRADESFTLGTLEVMPLSIDHDALEPVCFRIRSGNRTAGIVTDLGEYNDYLLENLAGLDVIMAEANHDIRMLEAGRYPYPLKQRILGKYGHLSNEASGRFISALLNDNVKEIILAHLSRENNLPDLAEMSVRAEIGSDYKISVASPDGPLETLEV